MKMIRNSTFKIPIVHVLTDTLPLFFPSLVIVVIHFEKWKLIWSSNLVSKSPPLLLWSEVTKKFSCRKIHIIMYTYSAWFCHYCTVIDGKLKVILYFVYNVVRRWHAFEMTGGLASQSHLPFLVHNYEKFGGGGYDLQGVLCNLMTSVFTLQWFILGVSDSCT